MTVNFYITRGILMKKLLLYINLLALMPASALAYASYDECLYYNGVRFCDDYFANRQYSANNHPQEQQNNKYKTYSNTTGAQKREHFIGLKLHKNADMRFEDSQNNETKNDQFGLSLNIGRQFNDFLKADAELLYTGSHWKNSDKTIKLDYSIFNIMANLYLTHEFFGVIAPYIGAGGGFANITQKIKHNDIKMDDDAFNFSYQFMIGVNFALSDKFGLDIGGKYIDYGDIETTYMGKKVENVEIWATEFYVGATYKF